MKWDATAIWKRCPETGRGALRVGANSTDRPPSALTWLEIGSNPYEMLASAGAACLAQAVAEHIEECDTLPESVEARASVMVDLVNYHWEIAEMTVEVVAYGVVCDAEEFQHTLNWAKERCPITHVLKVPVQVTGWVEASAASSAA